jgi:uncharacterized short protein YbdD (DUF466 family)
MMTAMGPSPNDSPARGSVRHTWQIVPQSLSLAWRFLRQVSGDDAYERYVEHMKHEHPDEPVMDRAQHFRFRQDEKWSRVTRCC